MTEERIKIYLDGQAQGFVNATSQAKSAITGLLKIFGMGVLAGGGIAIAQKGFQLLEKGIQGTINALKESIVEAGKEQETISKLNAVLKATGVYTDDYSQALIENSKVLQSKTTYTDEEVRSVEAQLAVYKLSRQEILDATEVTADMAATMGVDLGSAATIVGKAMEGLTTPLRRYGIVLDENRLKTEGNSYVLEVLRGRFEGVAEAQASTAEGLRTRFGNQIGELKERIGNAFLPAIQSIMDAFLNGNPEVDKFGNEIGDALTPMEKLQGFIGRAAEKIGAFVKYLAEADWSATTESLKLMGNALASLITGGSSFEMTNQKAQKFAETIARIGREIAAFLTAMDLTIQAFIILKTIIDDLVIGPVETFRRGIANWNFALDGNYKAIQANNFAAIDLGSKIEDLKNKIKNIIETGENFGRNIEDNTRKVYAYNSALSSMPREIYIDIYERRQEIKAPSFTGLRQSGGIIGKSQFATDLSIPLYKGEAVLPATLVRAIKENRGSFAGVGAGGGSPIINVNVTGNYISDSADEDRLADKVGNTIMKNLKLQGVYVG